MIDPGIYDFWERNGRGVISDETDNVALGF